MTPTDIIITDKKLTVILADGREISNPLDWFPWLANATPEQRANYELSPFSIDWLDLDNGVDIEGMLRGIKPKARHLIKA
jgi:hypothetical protein